MYDDFRNCIHDRGTLSDDIYGQYDFITKSFWIYCVFQRKRTDLSCSGGKRLAPVFGKFVSAYENDTTETGGYDPAVKIAFYRSDRFWNRSEVWVIRKGAYYKG